jgi:broad specificity phosphatase PhoE
VPCARPNIGAAEGLYWPEVKSALAALLHRAGSSPSSSYRRIGVSTHGAMMRQLMKHALPPGSPPAKTRDTVLYILRCEPVADRLAVLTEEQAG